MGTASEYIRYALENLNGEAYYPLIHFAKKHLDIDVEEAARHSILGWAKKYIPGANTNFAQKIFTSLDNAAKFVQNKLDQFSPKRAKPFFNYAKDTYAKHVFNSYYSDPENKEKFIAACEKHGKYEILVSLFKRLNKYKLSPQHLIDIKVALIQLVNDNSPQAIKKGLADLKAVFSSLPNYVGHIKKEVIIKEILEKIIQKNSLKEDLSKTFFSDTNADSLINQVQVKIQASIISKIKKAQAKEVYQYDGLIERVLPASLRGLYDVDRSVVEKIALYGDTSKPEDIFNFEVASQARYNSSYKVGHTGQSNRSTTVLPDIAMFFATKHGLRLGKPKSTWIMIYESTKGINTTELVNKEAKWTEFEFATPELKQGRFLGAVKFELNNKSKDKRNITFKAVDGFVAPKVHEGAYNKLGVEGDLKELLEVAKKFDKPNGNKKPWYQFKLPKSTKRISKKRSLFQMFLDKIGLSSRKDSYKKQRAKQINFVSHESNTDRKERLQQEKQQMWSLQNYLKNNKKLTSSVIKKFSPMLNTLQKKKLYSMVK